MEVKILDLFRLNRLKYTISRSFMLIPGNILSNKRNVTSLELGISSLKSYINDIYSIWKLVRELENNIFFTVVIIFKLFN